MLHIRAILGFLLLALPAVPLTARAQATTGTISGTVTDESKAVLPGVTVVVRNTETGATRPLVTDERGGFRALNLPPGIYSVTAELQGFTSGLIATAPVGRTPLCAAAFGSRERWVSDRF